MRQYEITTLILAFTFGLLGWLLSGLVGEYAAILVCVPPPGMYYIYGLMKNADTQKGAGDKNQGRSG